MVTSSHRPSAGFITRHVSPTLSPQPNGPHPLRRGFSSIFLPLQDKPSVCFKHTQWLTPSCFTYTFLFFPLLEHLITNPPTKKIYLHLITSVTILINSHSRFSLVISFCFGQCAFDPFNYFLSVLMCFNISDDPVIMPKITILHLFSFQFPFNVENKPNDGSTIRLY